MQETLLIACSALRTRQRQTSEEDPKLVRTLNTHYADAAPDGGLDTVERDALLDVLGKHFIGRLWPRSGGMDATRRFMADLQRAMTRSGWSVNFFAVA